DQVAELRIAAQRLEGPGLAACRAHVAGIAEQSLPEGAADRGGGALDRVRDILVVAIDQIPQLADGSAAVGGREAPRAVPGQVLDELAARCGPVLLLGTHCPQNRPLRPLG